MTKTKTKKPSVDTVNFASAVKIVCGKRKGPGNGKKKLVEAMGVKQDGFPRTDMSIFYSNLKKAESAGLIQLLSDGDCLWVVC